MLNVQYVRNKQAELEGSGCCLDPSLFGDSGLIKAYIKISSLKSLIVAFLFLKCKEFFVNLFSTIFLTF